MPRKKSATLTTLSQWAVERDAEDRDRAAREQQQSRTTELMRAFIAVRGGMPDTGDDEADALAFARQLGQIGRLVEDNPDLVQCQPRHIEAEQGSPKSYALTLLARASRGREAEAAGMLLDWWRASPRRHSEVLFWLTGGLEAIIVGQDQPAARAPTAGAAQSPTVPAEAVAGREAEGQRETAGTSEAQGGDPPASAAAATAPCPLRPAEGPRGGDCFAWGGASYPIPHLQWLLLKALWNRPQGVGTGQLLQAVYREDDAEGRLKALAHDLEVTLAKLRIPYEPSCRSERWRLVRLDAPHGV